MNYIQKQHLKGIQEDLRHAHGTTGDWAETSPLYRALNMKLLEAKALVEYIQEHFDEEEGDGQDDEDI